MPSSTLTPNMAFAQIVQLSDSHLFAEPSGALMGLNTLQSLTDICSQVLEEQTQIDAVLGTGDIAQEASFAAYEHFIEQAQRLGAPIRWLPGNHDEAAMMRGVSFDRALMQPVLEVGAWRVLLLDSSVEGQVAGFVTPDQLQHLEASLKAHPNTPHLICLHHHPVPIGCAWMEPIGLKNAAELLAITDHHPNAKALLWGHVHQEFNQMRGHTQLLATPSTCVQFKPNSVNFEVSGQAPGYRWLRLYADGSLHTGVSRLKNFSFVPSKDAKGY